MFLAILIYLALAGTTIITVAWYRLLGQQDAGRLSLFLFLVPVFGLAFAALALGEAVTPVQAVGATLLVASAITTAWPSPPATPPLPTGRARLPVRPATPVRRAP